jgi:hypothetical protein
LTLRSLEGSHRNISGQFPDLAASENLASARSSGVVNSAGRHFRPDGPPNRERAPFTLAARPSTVI